MRVRNNSKAAPCAHYSSQICHLCNGRLLPKHGQTWCRKRKEIVARHAIRVCPRCKTDGKTGERHPLHLHRDVNAACNMVLLALRLEKGQSVFACETLMGHASALPPVKPNFSRPLSFQMTGMVANQNQMIVCAWDDEHVDELLAVFPVVSSQCASTTTTQETFQTCGSGTCSQRCRAAVASFITTALGYALSDRVVHRSHKERELKI